MLCKVKIRVTAICNAGRYKAKTQYLNVNLDRCFDIGHSLFNIRREVKRRYLLTCTCYMLRRQIQNQKAVSECECELCFAIGHSLFDIRGEAGYLLDI